MSNFNVDLRRAQQRDAYEKRRIEMDLPFKCGVDDCRWSFTTERGRTHHRSRDHALRTGERQANVERVALKFMRGGKIDSSLAWMAFIETLPTRAEKQRQNAAKPQVDRSPRKRACARAGEQLMFREIARLIRNAIAGFTLVRQEQTKRQRASRSRAASFAAQLVLGHDFFHGE